jgi:serine/threonine protein kinase
MPVHTYVLESVAQAICAASGFKYGGGFNHGSFKETFLATKKEGDKLALKVLRPGCPTERSEREVDAMKRCAHPNIVALIELAEFEHAGTKYTYLLEKFMEGGTLDDRLRSGLLDRTNVLALGNELIRALVHIAAKDLVHRDFKPANILYAAPDGEALVCDFGIVRDLSKESLTKTFLLAGPGTPFFAAPEQLNNDKYLIDWRTDQFAVGVTLAFAHFGYHPYQANGESPEQAVLNVNSHNGPSERFVKAARASKMPALEKMVAPWPVTRFRQPDDLLEQWRKQGTP